MDPGGSGHRRGAAGRRVRQRCAAHRALLGGVHLRQPVPEALRRVQQAPQQSGGLLLEAGLGQPGERHGTLVRPHRARAVAEGVVARLPERHAAQSPSGIHGGGPEEAGELFSADPVQQPRGEPAAAQQAGVQEVGGGPRQPGQRPPVGVQGRRGPAAVRAVDPERLPEPPP
ncbi:hypothetical protein VR46_34660 [Streptomyces sp. NRRL S-444]|nr:hypothetical protein VR46_34660 [Streptomyces sp. NRRL S-444]